MAVQKQPEAGNPSRAENRRRPSDRENMSRPDRKRPVPERRKDIPVPGSDDLPNVPDENLLA
jgi:hypothetical protein